MTANGTRGRFGRYGLGVALLSAAVACGWIAGCNGDAAKTEKVSSFAGTAPVAGGTAVIALSSDPDVLNPLLYTSANAGLVFAEIHDGLAEMGDDLTYQPRIASRWEIAPDGLSVTYHMLPWRWSDGHPLAAADVVRSFELFQDPAVASPRRSFYRDVLRAVALDSVTVRYDLARPQPDPIQRTWHHILPEHLTRNLVPEEVRSWPLNQRPLSSGEFMLEDWGHNRSLSLVRNPYYPGKPALLDRVVFQILPEESARLVALETGEVDLVNQVPPDAARRLEKSGRAFCPCEPR